MVFARSCGTLLSTPTPVMILKHNNTQHRLTADDTEVFTHQVVTVVMMRASISVTGPFRYIYECHVHTRTR